MSSGICRNSISQPYAAQESEGYLWNGLFDYQGIVLMQDFLSWVIALVRRRPEWQDKFGTFHVSLLLNQVCALFE